MNGPASDNKNFRKCNPSFARISSIKASLFPLDKYRAEYRFQTIALPSLRFDYLRCKGLSPLRHLGYAIDIT